MLGRGDICLTQAFFRGCGIPAPAGRAFGTGFALCDDHNAALGTRRAWAYLSRLAMAYQIQTANAEFDYWSRTYDRSLLQTFLFRPSHKTLLEQVTHDDRMLLDVGCGTGQFAVTALSRFPNLTVFGLDLSEKMLDQGKERYRVLEDRLHVVRGDSEKLPFADDSFDVITCSHSFHHYPRQAAVVAEMHRVLKPEGKLLLIDGCRDKWWGWLIFDVGVTWAEGEVHHCSRERLQRLYAEAGFGDVEQINRGWLVPYMMTVGAAKKQAVVVPLPAAA